MAGNVSGEWCRKEGDVSGRRMLGISFLGEGAEIPPALCVDFLLQKEGNFGPKCPALEG